jgi:hypothetical protein
VTHPSGNQRQLRHRVDAVAGPDGAFDLVFPYATTGFLTPGEGGTNALVKPLGPVNVVVGGRGVSVDVPDRAVLKGERVAVVGP